MNYDENFFKNVKNFYLLAIENFNLINKQQQNLVDFFLQTQPDIYKDNLKKTYNEWIKNSEIALKDYQSMVIKGLDYLDSVYNKLKTKSKAQGE